MVVQTPPLLALLEMEAGDSVVLSQYHGIRVSIIADDASVLEASFVDDQEATVHGSPALLVDNMTIIELAWPWILITCNSGTGRVGQV